MDTATQLLVERGKAAFLQGEYRQSVDFFQQAIANLSSYAQESGEVQIWLVNAYQANNQSEAAIALCRELLGAPFPSVSQRAKKQLYILEAPKLERPKAWLTEIPRLDNLDTTQSRYVSSKRQTISEEPDPDDYEDLSEIETQENAFIWWALGLGITVMAIWEIMVAS